MPVRSFIGIIFLILISALSLMVSGQVVTFTAAGTRIPPDHPTYGSYEKPYFTTTITGVLTTPRAFHLQVANLFGTVPIGLTCKTYDSSDTLISNVCGTSGNTSPMQEKLVVEYKSQIRAPLRLTLTDPDSTVIASYSFPGLSPVTMTTMPLISFYPSTTLNQWRYKVLNPQQEYAVNQGTETLYLCHVDLCKPPSLDGNGIFDFFTFTDSTELTIHAEALSTHPAILSTTTYVKAPSERFAFVVPASNIEDISENGDLTLPLVNWPFVEGQTFQADETPTTLSYIHRITDTTPESNLVKVRWALWPAISTPTWYSQLPVDGEGNPIATDLRFHFPDVPLYAKYSKIVPVQVNLDNSCTCYRSMGQPSVCVPGSAITNSFEITAIECTFHVSKAALGDIGVLVEADKDDSALSDPFLIQLSYHDSSSATIRTYINKAPMIARNFNLLLQSLQWNVFYNNNNNARTLGLVSYQGGDYVKETFTITITGFLSNQPLFLATQTGDQVVCRPNDLDLPTSDKAHIGTPTLGLTSWTSNECAYYRQVSSDSSIDYTLPGSTPTYTVTERNFFLYRANSDMGDPWSRRIEWVDMYIVKPSFQPFPIPTSLLFPLMLPLDSWGDEFSLTSSIPDNNITDLSSIWFGAHTSTPRETIFTHTFIQRSSDPQYRLDGRSISLTDITSPSCSNAIGCRFQSPQDSSDPFVIYYKLSGDVDENKKDVVIFEAESSITSQYGGFISHNQHIYLFKPNIVSSKRLIYLYNTDIGYIDLMYDQVQQSNTPIQISSGEIDLDFTLCAETTDPILSYLGSDTKHPGILISVFDMDTVLDATALLSSDGSLGDFCKTKSSFFSPHNTIPINIPFYFSIQIQDINNPLTSQSYYSQIYTMLPSSSSPPYSLLLQFKPSGGGATFDLESDGNIINTPRVEYGTTASFKVTPISISFQSLIIQLYYKNIDTGIDELIKNIKTLSNTNGLIYDYNMKFNRIYENAFFRFSSTRNSGGIPNVVDSNFFDISPSCMGRNPSNPIEMISLCVGTNEQCLLNGKCEVVTIITDPTTPTVPPPSIPTPPTPERCPQCDQSNSITCTAQDEVNNAISTCQCNQGWSGLTCKQSTLCDPKKTKCNPENGYALPLQGTIKCESICHCYNEWAGLSCQTCQLQCFNDGLRYNDCARCGCQEGYSGSQCQCQSVIGKITLRATNDIIIASNGKLFTSDSELFQFHHDHSTKFIFSTTPTKEQMTFISILRDLYNDLKTPLTSSSEGKYIMTTHPSTDQLATIFTFGITFNCEGNNVHIKSLEMLHEKWNNFVNNFASQSSIQTYFTFDSTEDLITSEELEPIQPTLPPENEQLVNGTILHSFEFSLGVMMVVYCIVMMMT